MRAYDLNKQLRKSLQVIGDTAKAQAFVRPDLSVYADLQKSMDETRKVLGNLPPRSALLDAQSALTKLPERSSAEVDTSKLYWRQQENRRREAEAVAAQIETRDLLERQLAMMERTFEEQKKRERRMFRMTVASLAFGGVGAIAGVAGVVLAAITYL